MDTSDLAFGAAGLGIGGLVGLNFYSVLQLDIFIVL
jgi:hypothetical protein